MAHTAEEEFNATLNNSLLRISNCHILREKDTAVQKYIARLGVAVFVHY